MQTPLKPKTISMCNLCYGKVEDGTCQPCSEVLATLRVLADRACKMFDANREDFANTLPKKGNRISKARAVWCAAVREMSNLSYPQIAYVLGCDHSTVLLGARRGWQSHREQVHSLIGSLNGHRMVIRDRRGKNEEEMKNRKKRQRWTKRAAVL